MLFNKSLNICNYWGRELRLTWPANGWEGDTMGPTDCNDCTSQSQISLFNRKWSKLRAHDATVCREQQQKKKRNTKTKQIRMACYVMGMLRYFWLSKATETNSVVSGSLPAVSSTAQLLPAKITSQGLSQTSKNH